MLSKTKHNNHGQRGRRCQNMWTVWETQWAFAKSNCPQQHLLSTEIAMQMVACALEILLMLARFNQDAGIATATDAAGIDAVEGAVAAVERRCHCRCCC